MVYKVPPQDQDVEVADRDVRVIGRELEELSHCPSASLTILGQPWVVSALSGTNKEQAAEPLQRSMGAARRTPSPKKSGDLW